MSKRQKERNGWDISLFSTLNMNLAVIHISKNMKVAIGHFSAEISVSASYE